MIRGIHGLLYSSDPEATRRFFKEAMKLPGSDIGEGWWIFDFREGDLGVHPVRDPSDAGEHDVSFYCDDIHGTVADLKSRGVHFTQDVEDQGYGFVTYFTAPGGITIQLYEPRYEKRRTAAPAKAGERKAVPKKKARKRNRSRKSSTDLAKARARRSFSPSRTGTWREWGPS